GFDFDESAFDRLFHRGSEIAERFYFLAVHFGYGQIRKFVIADGVVSRKDLTQDYDAAMLARKQFGLEPVKIDETLGRFALPVWSPLLEILAGQLLENKTAEHEILRRFVQRVGRADVV